MEAASTYKHARLLHVGLPSLEAKPWDWDKGHDCLVFASSHLAHPQPPLGDDVSCMADTRRAVRACKCMSAITRLYNSTFFVEYC
jgi:hypothetical protein